MQRAVLLLRDVFDLDYDDVADAVEKTPGNCWQIAGRAREAVGRARRRFPVDAEQEERLVIAFATAVGTGDLDALTALLARDAVLWSDGGGRVTAARKPIYGPDKVARFILGVNRKTPENATLTVVRVNGDPDGRSQDRTACSPSSPWGPGTG